MRTIAEVLAELRELATKAQNGEDVTARKAEVERELAALGYQPTTAAAPGTPAAGTAPAAPAPAAPASAAAALSATDAADLERLRADERDRQIRSAAEQFADVAQRTVEQQQTAQAQAMATAMGAALAERGLVPASGQDPALQAAVMQVLGQTRGGSRFAGPDADPQVAAHLAAGGSVGADGTLLPGTGVALPDGRVSQPGALQVGADRALQELEDSKSLGRLMSVVARAQKAPWALEDHEQRFLRKIGQKAMAQGTPSAGGILVPVEWMPDILDLIRANAVVRRANPRVVPFNKEMHQTSVSTGSTAYYTQENARIPVSEMTFAEAPILTPKYLTALVPVSNYLLGNAAGVDTLVRDDMTAALSTREDLAFLQGTGAGGEPIGFRNIPGVILNPIAPGANGFVPTLPDFRRIKGRTRLIGKPNPRWTWFFHPALLTYLETLTDTTGRFLVDTNILQINADGVSGTFDGLPFYASYQIPTALSIGTSNNATYLLLVDMSDALLGESVDLQIDVSSEATYSPDGGTTHISAFQQNQTVFRVIVGHDVNHRRPASGIIDQEGVLV